MPPELVQRLRAGDRGAVAEALNLADDRRPAKRAEALALLDALDQDAPFPGAARVGVTGAPGAGKSTLLDALVRGLRRRDATVAVVAVDPSSQRTGGALLGDRIRMRSGAGDPGVFIRSMAARDRLGGLAESTWAAVSILAASFDHVFVETVGVGQSEGEIAALADSLLFVANPGGGDTLQFMKAGILELPDLFAVNKADVGPLAERTARELEGGLRLTERDPKDWAPPVELVSARDGTGIDALLDLLDTHREHALAAGQLAARRESGRRRFVVESLRRRFGSFGLERVGGVAGVEDQLNQSTDESAFAALARLTRTLEERLGGA
ncbi:MAG: methylmalonyl Co-A mutase-associated GTPase MeaB [Myxococcota bacterium]